VSTARKTVTILFCDVTGSTALGEELDPESLREVIQRYFTEMRAVIERHGGTVEKFIGDAVMSVFGVPQIHEDDALRAVRAAIEMQSALDALNVDVERQWGTRIQARIGLNTGEVLAADPASGQSFVSGDAVNVAADLALVMLEMDGREREVLALADTNVPLMIDDDVDAVVRWDAARARAMVRLGDAAEAERLARRSVERAWATEYSELRALSQVALAEVLQGSGRREEAAEALRKAVAVHEAKGDVVSAATTGQKLEDMETVAPKPGPTSA
jgi:hypothetical protein